MSYRAPIQDIRFNLRHLADLQGVLALPGFEELSEDLVDAVLDENARFVEQAIAPLNRSGDTAPATWSDGKVTTSPGFKEAFEAFAQGGWQGLQHDVEWGGQGLPKLVGAPASENINAANLAFSLCPLLTDGVIEALTAVGSKAQQSLFIPPMLEGRWTGTMNLTEPQAGSDLAQVATKAVPRGEGVYGLFGQKIFITYGEHDMAENIVHLVLARTPDAPKGVKGISLFIVPKFLVDADGSLGERNDVVCASLEHKLGIHGSPTAVLMYGSNGGEGATGYLVGEENRGLEYMFIMMNAARYAVGVQGVALSERALQQATAYANERVQGQALEGSAGPVTIAHHPDVQRMLLTMRGLTEGARALAYVAAAACDKSRRHPDPAEQERNKALYEYLVPVVKGFSTEASVEVASLGVQVHGGMGFIEETGAAQYYRDARILPIYEGTTAIQANDFVGRKILRNGGQVARHLAAEMRATVSELQAAASASTDHSDGLALIGRRLDAAVTAYEQATEFALKNSQASLPAVFLGSVPYLMLAGVVHAGWQLARAALVCSQPSVQQQAPEFCRQKLATSVFYAAHILPRAQACAQGITEGVVANRYAATTIGI
ncbi:acyl-CoA dehydrogenase [Pollutimonas thiosulfatoxidans]|uniref:3-methylmercaptopropionyl-CoA dehydrogenase n=1 Tax=Pollutimonas thiosulfatoxidans TaxID=2028345 RepID=A0A410GBI2_9BURK|nr:acyl-CoA dehydrogenase [Pollutimonas thiosulfatoxidans]NYT46167.1 acyl-CoA dehydrogenase [Alcaligenaceae bacterium]QAA93641.1 acyl-CoA dehydrogenase [Pollutimonas thiosulfatoxidans]